MSDKPHNIGDTLSSGIQDVAALLPLLGTDQCEQHVGSALEKGFLYAALSTLSIFGSLGTVKAGFAALLATITYPFYGGRWLADAGFATPGSVSSMVTISKDTGRYGAEVALEKLLKNLPIEDPTLVDRIDWSGWKYEGSMPTKRVVHPGKGSQNPVSDGSGDVESGGSTEHAAQRGGPAEHAKNNWVDTLKVYFFSWNVLLILSSFLSALVSVTPYLYLMGNNWNRPLSWLFPLLRSFGSFFCVVAIQLALQLRIHQIANLSLTWMKIQKERKPEDDAIIASQPTDALEERIRSRIHLSEKYLFRRLQRENVDEEKRNDCLELPKDKHNALVALLATNWYLVLYQFIIAIGMGMIVTGYVGCFSLVNQTQVPNAPYVWFALETALSIIRMFSWGFNPHWDEKTSMRMTLKLHEMGPDSSFPHITSPYDDKELGLDSNDKVEQPQSFVVQSQSDFLAMATEWTGPLPWLDSNVFSLFYSVLAKDGMKHLYTTILFTDSRSPPLTFSAKGPHESRPPIYTCSSKNIPSTRALHVTLGNQASATTDTFINSQSFHKIANHSLALASQLFSGKQYNITSLGWNLINLPLTDNVQNHTHISKPLSSDDHAYMALSQLWTLKSEYCQARGKIFEELAATDAEYCQQQYKHVPASLHGEVFLTIESVILELQLWHEETTLANNNKGGNHISRQILSECIAAMESRIANERKQVLLRCRGYNWQSAHGWTPEIVEAQWNYPQQMLVQLRESESYRGGAEEVQKHVLHLYSDFAKSVTAISDYLENVLPEWSIFNEWLRHFFSGMETEPQAGAISTDVSPEKKLHLMLHLLIF
ncbi:hypothetical protein Moror_9490 [Moniliophthora roreri MCA 2997]|uniref:Uncharacterized protein n=1 Tax=Moniliophthora roreri (strain MCA 2997) TaxID=1381753 RepID=V2X0G8_MONRO|nr:hypothetical protein Moror_9490 [Moniliophthora roreri MCA 2997]KAI3599051.1 hypothetical protein WG66_004061 [Moniliophthora roreri]